MIAIKYFQCNICNYKFAILPPQQIEEFSSFSAEREYVNLLFDLRAHIEKHKLERANHKIDPTILLNMFTIV